MDGIVLLAKQPGLTSFSSLHNVKKALKTTKVGHTGTLDSFAQGLLVVCTGRFTRLAGKITEFDKTYKAVLKFGTETDTLEYTGNVIKTTGLPKKEKLLEALKKFNGELDQMPPAFSAIHIDGKRASDLARKGKDVEIPSRKITVYKAELQEIKENKENEVEACLIEFKVSKGTYIRSLARDIGNACGSSAHLIGLYRTQVGNFKVEDSAAYSLIKDFNIDNAYEQMSQKNKDFFDDDFIKNEITEKIKTVTKEISLECGFYNIDLVDEYALSEFQNGKPIKNRLYVQNLYDIPENTECAVFYNNIFTGLLNKNSEGKIRYSFVIN